MAMRMNMVAIMVMFLGAAMLNGSSAQTTYTVGGALGWLVPPNGAGTYATWAANQTFTVGDILVFNFATGNHDVAKVPKAAFDACNPANAISASTTGPARITLNSAGEHFFFCRVGSHCSLGQKLAVNVSAASAPLPPPSAAPSPPPSTTPSPRPAPTTPAPSPRSAPTPAPSAPTPTPSRSPSPSPMSTPSPTGSPVPAPAPSAGGMEYIVGDAVGWIVPTGGASVYQTWAANKTFRVGDVLVFNFMNGAHTVAEVPETAFNSCNVAAATNTISTSPARITLNTSGEHFFICTVPNHCTGGQKLAINIAGASSPSPIESLAPPPLEGSSPPPIESLAPPPPEGSAASFTAAALPITLLSIAMALLY